MSLVGELVTDGAMRLGVDQLLATAGALLHLAIDAAVQLGIGIARLCAFPPTRKTGKERLDTGIGSVSV